MKQREIFTAKQRHFEALQAAVIKQTIKSGMTSLTIKELYGEPDDIFSSGSTTGRFEIWSYEEVTPSHQPTWRPIRLYFNNEKLVSWDY